MLYVCIPAYNEAATVGVLLWRLRTVLGETGRDYEVVVYDDGSTDSTADVLAPYRRVLPLTVLGGRDAPSRGRSAATEVLLRHVVAHSRYPRRDACVVWQADFTDRPEDLPALLPPFDAGADLVVGQRPTDPAQPAAERRLRRMGPWVLRPLVRAEGVDDLLTSARLFRVAVLRELVRARGALPVVDAPSWAGVAELLVSAVPFARRVELVDVPARYDVRPRASRLDWAAELRALARYAWRARGTHVRPGAPRTATRDERAEPPAAAAPAPVTPPRPAGTGAGEPRPERPRRAARRDRGGRGPGGDMADAPAPGVEVAAATSKTAGRGRRGGRRAEPLTAPTPAEVAELRPDDGPPATGTPGLGGEVEPALQDEPPDADGAAPTPRRKKRRRRRARTDGVEVSAAEGAAGGDAVDLQALPEPDTAVRGTPPEALPDAEPGLHAGSGPGTAPAARRRKRRRGRSAGRPSGVAPAVAPDATPDAARRPEPPTSDTAPPVTSTTPPPDRPPPTA